MKSLAGRLDCASRMVKGINSRRTKSSKRTNGALELIDDRESTIFFLFWNLPQRRHSPHPYRRRSSSASHMGNGVPDQGCLRFYQSHRGMSPGLSPLSLEH